MEIVKPDWNKQHCDMLDKQLQFQYFLPQYIVYNHKQNNMLTTIQTVFLLF